MAITVDNDPVAINEYRGRIQDAITKLETQLQKTEVAIDTVSESWKDSNFIEFYTHFNEDKKQIVPLCEVLKDYESNILYQLETKLRTYKEGPTKIM